MSSDLVPPSRLIDPRGQRFGAAVSAALLLGACLLGLPWLAALVSLDLAAGAFLGTRYFLPGRPWPFVRGALGLGPTEPEHEYPPRFAQALGATFVGLGVVAIAVGATPLGWLPILAVVGLQALLATTGTCIGCRLYFLRWWVPELFARAIRRGDALAAFGGGAQLRRPDA